MSAVVIFGLIAELIGGVMIGFSFVRFGRPKNFEIGIPGIFIFLLGISSALGGLAFGL